MGQNEWFPCGFSGVLDGDWFCNVGLRCFAHLIVLLCLVVYHFLHVECAEDPKKSASLGG